MVAAVNRAANGRSRIPTGVTRTVTGPTTSARSDNNGLITLNSASPAAVTIPNDATGGWASNEFLSVYQAGAGQASFAAGSGVTLRAPSGIAAGTQYGIIAAMRVGPDEWVLV